MKRIIINISMIFILILSLTGCGGFIASDELQIEEITHDLLSDGRTQVTITYVDDVAEPAVFYLPKGDDGNSVEGIYPDTSSDALYTKLKIVYTDKEETYIQIKNGVSIVDTRSVINAETGNTEITFIYSDGTESAEPIIIQKGEKGEKGDSGISIVDCEIVENNDGSITVTFVYSDETKSDPINIPKGVDGVGIKRITKHEDDEKYYMIIEYTQGDPVTLEFARPDSPNQWLRGEGIPAETLGKDGDFYYDVNNNIIYTKVVDAWTEIIDFDEDEEKYTITFDKNGDDATLSPLNTTFTINRGQYFATSGYSIPVPTREGYTFGGWYIQKNPNLSINGAFTDLTPVFSDLKLYAYWIAN